MDKHPRETYLKLLLFSLIEDQSEGEWDEDTIKKDVEVFWKVLMPEFKEGWE